MKLALDKLRQTAKGKFRKPDKYEYDHGGIGNFCWAILGDQWYAKGLPYYDEQTRPIAIASLKKYFHDDVLVPERFKEREYPKGSGMKYLILEGPGIGSWGVLGDAGKFSSNLLETVWAYAHYTGDWDLVRERWPLIKRLFCTAAETRWVSFARDAIAEMGDEAPSRGPPSRGWPTRPATSTPTTTPATSLPASWSITGSSSAARPISSIASRGIRWSACRPRST